MSLLLRLFCHQAARNARCRVPAGAYIAAAASSQRWFSSSDSNSKNATDDADEDSPENAPASVLGPLATLARSAASREPPLTGFAAAGTTTDQQQLFSLRQVSKHDSSESAWIVVDGSVYDVTTYLDEHPGGADSILLEAGADASEAFNSIHSDEAKALLKKFKIGALAPSVPAPAAAATDAAAAVAPAAAAAAAAAEAILAEARELRPPDAAEAAAAAATGGAPVALVDPRTKYDLPLASTERLSHDTYLLRFALPSAAHRVGLPCGKHVFVFADVAGETVARAYTPVSSDRDLGQLALMVKVYWPTERFPAGGKMSQHLASLKPGDTISVKGPVGKFEYHGRGQYTLNRRPGAARWLSLVAGGSGITPCWQVLRDVLEDPDDATRVALLYANKAPGDIWLKSELDALAARHPDRFNVRYVLEQPPADGWHGSTGRVTLDMLAQHLLPSGPGSLALLCGPPPFLEHAVLPGLKELGFQAGGAGERDDIVVF